MTQQDLANFIWQVADLLRGPYRPPQYERVMLPMVVLRRFDCVLAETKPKVISSFKRFKKYNSNVHDPKLNRVAGGGKDIGFHNHSELDFEKLKGDPDNIGRHLADYIAGYSENVRKIFDRFEFTKEIEKLEEANRLYLVVSKFADIDLGQLNTHAMGLLFEDLIRRFNEAANETAGDHFTPREVIRLMVNLLLEPDDHILTTPGILATICDPACGTGGMLSEAENWIKEHNPNANVQVYGQDYNARSYAVAASDLLIKGQHDGQIELGNTLTKDNFARMEFDYLLANPPFGVDWKAEKQEIDRLSNFHGYEGKLPRVNDGALLFLLYMIGHFQEINSEEKKIGSRCAIVFNGSPLFAGGAGSGESEIRRWIIENDWLEAIVAIPEQMFYNTGIGTFIWVVTNRKSKDRKGKIQLIDARQRYEPMRRSLGDKRRFIDDKSIQTISREHGSKRKSDTCKMFDNADFGYRRVIIERPLRLRFQITQEATESFLDAYPQFLDTIQSMKSELGTEPHLDWNEVRTTVQEVAKKEEIKWTSASKKLFRECYTTVDPDAEPVIAKRLKTFQFDAQTAFPRQKLHAKLSEPELAAIVGVNFGSSKESIEYEADSDLRKNENIPLKDHVVDYFLREVRPFVDDAWIDRSSKSAGDELDDGIGKVGYEINFNREYFRYVKPQGLSVIDAELGLLESRISALLKNVTNRGQDADVIARAVGRGLDPSARLTDFGLQWSPLSPSHWTRMQLKRTWASSDYGTSESIRDKGDIRVLRMSCITADGEVDLSAAGQIEEISDDLLIRENDLLFNRTNSLEQIAKVGIVRETPHVPTSFASYLVRLRTNKWVDPRFLAYLLNSSSFLRYARSNAIPAIGQANLSPTRYGELLIALPPLDEQREIVALLDDLRTESIELQTLLGESAKVLQQRTDALVRAAVTGVTSIEK